MACAVLAKDPIRANFYSGRDLAAIDFAVKAPERHVRKLILVNTQRLCAETRLAAGFGL